MDMLAAQHFVLAGGLDAVMHRDRIGVDGTDAAVGRGHEVAAKHVADAVVRHRSEGFGMDVQLAADGAPYQLEGRALCSGFKNLVHCRVHNYELEFAGYAAVGSKPTIQIHLSQFAPTNSTGRK